MAEGDDRDEAYTATMRGYGASHERTDAAGAEAVCEAEGNMCGAAMRGADALPGFLAISRTEGSRRNLGDLYTPPIKALYVYIPAGPSALRAWQGHCALRQRS
jgi:hypothetical protein